MNNVFTQGKKRTKREIKKENRQKRKYKIKYIIEKIEKITYKKTKTRLNGPAHDPDPSACVDGLVQQRAANRSLAQFLLWSDSSSICSTSGECFVSACRRGVHARSLIFEEDGRTLQHARWKLRANLRIHKANERKLRGVTDISHLIDLMNVRAPAVTSTVNSSVS